MGAPGRSATPQETRRGLNALPGRAREPQGAPRRSPRRPGTARAAHVASAGPGQQQHHSRPDQSRLPAAQVAATTPARTDTARCTRPPDTRTRSQPEPHGKSAQLTDPPLRLAHQETTSLRTPSTADGTTTPPRAFGAPAGLRRARVASLRFQARASGLWITSRSVPNTNSQCFLQQKHLLLSFQDDAGQGRASSTPPSAPRQEARLQHATESTARSQQAQSQVRACCKCQRPLPNYHRGPLAPRLPQPDPARLHASEVEPSRSPASPPHISNHAENRTGDENVQSQLPSRRHRSVG